MNSYIPKEKLTAWERWEMAAFDEQQRAEEVAADEAPVVEPQSPEPVVDAIASEPEPDFRNVLNELPSAEEIERWRSDAHDLGFQEGRAAGYAAGRLEGQAAVREEAQHMASIAQELTEAIGEIENRLGEQLLELALDIAGQVLRTGLEVRRELMLPVVREAMSMLPAQHGHPTLRLHPEDLALVRKHLADQFLHTGWRLIEDAEISRGGCRVESAGSNIDATLPTRWRRVIETLGAKSDWIEPDA